MKTLLLDITFNSKDNVEIITSAGYGFIRIESKTSKNKTKLVKCEYKKFDFTLDKWVYYEPFSLNKTQRQEVVKILLLQDTTITNISKLLSVSESTINRDIKFLKESKISVKKK